MSDKISPQLRWRKAICASALDPSAKLVALVLDTFMGGEGLAWPSKAKLAGLTGLSVRTVDRAVLGMEAAGFLVVQRSRGRFANRYREALPNPVASDGVEEANPVTDDSPTPQLTTPNPVTVAHEAEKKPYREAKERAPDVQSLVAYYVDQARELGADPPDRLKQRWARELGRLAGRYDENELRAGIDAMLAKRLVQPSPLESVLFELKLGPRPATQHEHPIDRRFRETYGFDAAELNRPDRSTDADRPRLRVLPPGGDAT